MKYWDITQKELERLIKKAGDFIGTDESLRTWACVDVALDHAINLRDEVNELRRYYYNDLLNSQ